jgi:hypothetical protein
MKYVNLVTKTSGNADYKKVKKMYYFYLMYKLWLLLISAFFVLFSEDILGQNEPKDTLSVIEDITHPKDSLVRNPGGSLGKWNHLSDSLFLTNNPNRFNRELYNLLQKFYNSQPKNKKIPVTNVNLTAYDGLIIRKIQFRTLNVFSGSIEDTSYVPSTWTEKAVTAIHFNTREKIIRKNLLFQKDDRLDVFLVAENERLIRELPYIRDAKFLINPIPGSPDSIDIILLMKDLIPLGLSAELSRPDAGNASIGYYNIFGYGHQFETTTYWDGRHTPFLGYKLLYGIPNIQGTYISSDLEYTHRWNTDISRIRIERNFRTVGIKYAGAVELTNADLHRDLVLLDTTIKNITWKYTNYDFWIGRLFSVRKGNTAGTRKGLFLSGRAFYNYNRETPPTEEHNYYTFQDKTMLLFSTGYTYRGFRKDNMIFTFDRIEDVPYGYMFEITSGYEWGQYAGRPYFAANISFGKYMARHYLYGQFGYGTFVHNHSLEQGTIHLQLKGFSNLNTWGMFFQNRNFFTFTYLNGINRFKDEFTRLENIGGIAGLYSPSLRGNEKFVLNLESVLFSPYRLLGFRFAFFASVDLGFIKTENLSFYESTPYSGLGLGVRIRNERLVFDTFEIKFSIYPGMPADADPMYINAGSIPRLRSNVLFPDKPTILEYN